MLDCHACLWRCLRAIASNVRPSPFYSRSLHRAPLPTSRLHQVHLLQRSYVTAVAQTAAQFSSDQAADVPDRPPWRSGRRNRRAVANTHRDPTAKVVDYDEGQIRQELRYLKDPLKLADHVRHMLRQGEEDKAMFMVRVASKEIQCTVSWNHLIDYQMKRDRVKAALKTYNDMKKRAQIPDSHTYLLVLRGLADHAYHTFGVGNALSLYHSMSAPNSRVQPSVIHTNAVLKVCARAGNMDAMWGVASKIPEKGPGAADSLTFTTILNAIRQDAIENVPQGLSEGQLARRREQAIVEGRRIWEDIVNKWRTGNILIDETLVCAMGRLLLIGSRPRDWDDVLSLVEQTMNIPRLVPRLGTGARERADVPRIRAPYTPPEMKDEDDPDVPDEERRGAEFDPVDVSKSVGRGSQRNSPAYAQPSTNTLSLLLEACLRMVAKKPAMDYWSLLTDAQSYGVQPDPDNFHMLLRMLRQSRSSGEAVELLRHDMAHVKPMKKTFRIAMSACVRDKLNPHAMAHAGCVLGLMANKLEDPDVQTLLMYVELTLACSSGADVVRALDRLGPTVLNLRSMINYGTLQGRAEMDPRDRETALEVIKKMIGCYDRIMNRGEVPREEYSKYMPRRSKLAAFVTRMANKSYDAKDRAWDATVGKKIERRVRERKQQQREAEAELALHS